LPWPVASQQIPDWTKAHIGAFEYYGGVPEVIVPDQLKSGVKTSCRYDPEINPVYSELCAHYGVVVIPARHLEPRDKAKVENGVLNTQRRILAALRNRTFFSLPEINDAIAVELEKLNNRPMQGLGKSRNELFAELDKPALKTLPQERFQLREWKKAKVNIDDHITVHGSWYSVPYTLIGKEVEVCLTITTVEVLHNGKRVASPLRIGYQCVKNILDKGLERTELQLESEELQLPLEHDNIRGSSYYAGGAK
jgi:transposase